MVAALSKYWKPISEKEYLDTMDIPITNLAVKMAQFPQHIEDEIWEIQRDPFSVW